MTCLISIDFYIQDCSPEVPWYLENQGLWQGTAVCGTVSIILMGWFIRNRQQLV